MVTLGTTQQEAGERVRAGFASRTLAFAIDLLLAALILLVAALSLQIVGTFFPIGKIIARLAGIDPTGTLRPYLALGVAIVVFVAYNTFWWTMIEETPGKAALGLRVVRTSGQRLTIWRSIVRSLAYWVSALPLFLGFLWILVDHERQGWHDKIADTCVIYARQPRAAIGRTKPARGHTAPAS